MTPEEKLKSLGIELPELPMPLGSYVPFVRTGDLVFLSGMLPLKEGKLITTGRVGEAVTLEEANACARAAAVNALAVLKSAAGGLDKVVRCVMINGFVASADDFVDQPKVINGASDLIFQVFGDQGLHARTAVGVNVLPLKSPVEIAFIFEVRAQALPRS
ncbi:MAG: RidA family protein [Nitrospiraceae bacterium]|nr:RidA family protein [Nitrospiraceae bacterium]